jgi:mRNA-degrading endonuclease RelE of RelBE toxin-antitoxin system
VPKRRLRIAPDAKRQFKELSAADQAKLKNVMRACLEEDDATVTKRNRFALRRPSELAHFEFRVGDLRVFYRVVEGLVQVVLIGRKRGNPLFVEGKRFTL